VEEGYRRMLREFQRWINERADAGDAVTYVDGMMIAHNLYKAIMQDLSERVDPGTHARLYGVGLRRLAQALLSPEESRKAEQEIKANMVKGV